MLANGVISARSVAAFIRSDVASAVVRSASSIADPSVLDHPNSAPPPKKRTATDVLDRAHKLKSEVSEGDELPPSIAPATRKTHVAPIGRVNPVHSAIYRELNQLSTPAQILTHYRKHQDEYGIINLTMAMNKIIQYGKLTKSFKSEAVNKRLLDQLCYNSVSVLRDALKLDRDYSERVTGSLEAGRQKDGASSTHTLPVRTISSMLHHLSKLQRCPTSLLQEVSYVMQDRVKEMSPIDVAQLTFAYAAANVPAPIFFNKIAGHVSRDLDRYSDAQVISVLTGFANLKTAAPQLFYAIAERLVARKEQAHTVTPRILASAVGAMAKGVLFDKHLPTRLRKAMSAGPGAGDKGVLAEDGETGKGALAMMYSHKETTARALTLLAPRIESSARAARVPKMRHSTTVDRQEAEDKAFTAQGLAQVAWAYSTAFQAFAEVLHGPSQCHRAAHMLVRAARMGGSAGLEAAKGTMKDILEQGVKIVLQQDKWATPNIPDAVVVSTMTAVLSSFTHPQTLSTASMSQMAITAAALNAVRTKLLLRLATVQGIREELDKLPITAGTPSAAQVLDDEIAKFRTLVLQLQTRKHLAAIATAMINILDPSTGGKAMEAKAAEGRAAVTGLAAIERSLANDHAALQSAVVDKLLSGKGGKKVKAGEVQAIAEALDAPGEEEFDAEAKEALALLQRQTGGGGSGSSDSESSSLSPYGSTSAQQSASLAEASDRALAQLRVMGDKMALAEEEDEGEAGGALAEEEGGGRRKYNPLAYEQAVALGTPVSLHDVSEAAAVYAECAPLLHVPELWAKLADRVEAGVLAQKGRGAWDKPEDHATLNRRPAHTDWGNMLSLASMAPVSVSNLALSFMQAAPDAHAARVMKAIALTFTLNSPKAPPALLEAIQPLSKIVEGKRNYRKGGEGANGASSSPALPTPGTAPLSAASLPVDPSVTPTFDEAPTWLDQAKEAIRRSRTFKKAPITPVHRLRGSPLPGRGLVEYEPGSGEPGAESLPGEGDPDEELVIRAEAPALVQGTETNWAARVLYRNSAENLFKLALAFVMCCPPKPLQGQPEDMSLTHLHDQVLAMYEELDTAHPLEEAGDTEGTAELYTERLAQSLQVSRVAAVQQASMFTLPRSWLLRDGPLGHETPAEYPAAEAALDARAGSKEEEKNALKYSEHPVLSSRRWARGLRAFTYAGHGDARSQLGAVDPRLAAVPDTTVRACFAYMVKNLCMRLGERVAGNEMRPEDVGDCLAISVGRDFSLVQDPLLQICEPKWFASRRGKQLPLYHSLVALQAAWLDGHLTSSQENAVRKVADIRKAKSAAAEGRNTAAAHGKAGPWLPSPQASSARTTYQPPTHLNCSLHVYGQIGVAIGAVLWDRLVQSGFRITPRVMESMQHHIRVLLILCDEASRRMAMDTRQGRAMVWRPEGGLVPRDMLNVHSGGGEEDSANSQVGLRLDNALSAFATSIACAVTPLALASIPTGPGISEDHRQRAHALRKISRRFIELAAAGAAQHVDPRKLNLNLSHRAPLPTIRPGDIAVAPTPSARAEDAPVVPRAVLRASVAAVTLHAYSLITLLQQGDQLEEEARQRVAVEALGKAAPILGDTAVERMQ